MDLEKLKQLSQPLIEYIKINCNPYTRIVISDSDVRVVEDVAYIPK